MMFEGIPKASSTRGPSSVAGPSMPSPTRGTTLEEDQVYNPAIDKGARLVCDACGVRTSKRWWKIPRTVGSGVWCEADGQTYLKYAWVPRQESARIATVGDKREATPLSGANPSKRPKVSRAETVRKYAPLLTCRGLSRPTRRLLLRQLLPTRPLPPTTPSVRRLVHVATMHNPPRRCSSAPCVPSRSTPVRPPFCPSSADRIVDR